MKYLNIFRCSKDVYSKLDKQKLAIIVQNRGSFDGYVYNMKNPNEGCTK